MTRNRWQFLSALALAGLLCVAPAWALQKLEVKPDTTATARIALKETSRIKVDGLAIVDVFGSVYAPDNTAGELMVAPDAASGEMYVMPSAMARRASRSTSSSRPRRRPTPCC
jgi:hypothetical protein